VHEQNLKIIRNKKGFIIDMDGVMYHQSQLIPGAQAFTRWLHDHHKEFLFLTNSSNKTPLDLAHNLRTLGIETTPEHFYTSGLAVASFLQKQKPNGTAYVIGDAGLVHALYNVGYTMTDYNPDFVVVGETTTYNFSVIEKAINLVRNGAKLVGTNYDILDKTKGGFTPAGGTLMAPIALASGVDAYFVGKPNPLIMNTAMNKFKCEKEDIIIVGDRMDTDIVAGVESGIDTLLVLSGVTAMRDLAGFSFKPDFILPSVKSIIHDL